MFSPIEASQNIKDEFSGYISTSFHLADKEYAKQFSEALAEEGAIAKGPYLDIGDSFKPGLSLEDLIKSGDASPLFRELEGDIPDGEKEIKIKRKLYLHQQKAVEKTNAGKNLVVTTGTGSGKTECFIIPILNYLLKEKEAGTLNDGVRAILIYPMNALANDQMKRLRATLKSYPEITFGVYNSSTQQKDADGISEYGRIFKDESGKPLKPLPNEIISRETMQKKPPHILVTNYAMLEYMLLRPNDDRVFSRAQLRFLVLDEAHIYRGATGIETSLLLRRLKARISDPSKVLHILTSATLGGKEANADIVTFASRLCEAAFDENDIIRSETQSPEFPDEEYSMTNEIFAELADPQDSLNHILEKYNIPYDSNMSDAEIIYDLCIHSHAYKVLRQCAVRPFTVKELTKLMRELMEIDEEDVVNLINVAVKAEKNKTVLIKARYHMFARALEGAYITLNPTKKLFLRRNNYFTIGQDNWKIFEAAVCDDCGRVGVVGKTVNDRLEFAGNRFDEEAEFYLIKEKDEILLDDDDSEDDEVDEIGKNDYLICPKCGEIHHKSLVYDFKCEHDKSTLVELVLSERKGTRNEPKCPCCNFGHMKSFYLGYDAATAVLGTSLFEQLPESEVKLETKVIEETPTSSLFAPAVSTKASLDVVKRKRQFLAFSDSRGEAAFYACYMTSFYEEFLRRRGIWNVVKANARSMSDHPWEITTLVDELTSYFDTHRTFAEPGDKGNENLTPVSQRQAWIAVLNEMVNARRSTSLVSLGIINFTYKGNAGPIMAGVAQKYNQSVEDMMALFNLLVMDIVYSGAIEGATTLTNDEREYIYYTAKPRRFTKCKEIKPDKNQNYLNGWIPRTRTNGSMFKNGRVTRIARSLGISETEAKGLLEDYWNAVLAQGEFGLTPVGDGEYYISTDKFVVTSGTESTPIYVCEKCGKTTMFSDKMQCVSIKCDGKLRKITHEDIIRDNHFAKLYSSEMMKPLHIKEHTAQLGRAEQQAYQEMFVNKDINALSCSTTFEMGVDVGDLETVYLRNMPPSPSNYVQRAGRAGRSIHAAAYSLTYAKLSSHDFTYFEKPERMITGKIGVPLFSIENEKVVARHIYAVALSAFFADNEDVYNRNDADVFLNQDGFERFVTYLQGEPEELKEILEKSIPENLHSRMGINDFGWTEGLIGSDGVLTVAVEEFRRIVEYYEKEFKKLKKTDTQAAARCERKLQDYRKSKDDKKGRNELIEFLVRNNVLPKYGFPVDTVELYQNMDSQQDKKLQMVRDLQLAIAEYAPDAQVVADGKLYTSRYIRKLPQTTGQDWEVVYIAQCSEPSCKTWNHRITEPAKEGEKCVSCGSIIEKSKWKKAIEPRKGFIADAKPTDVPLRKPDKSYRSDDYYIGDAQRQVMIKRTYQVNGLSKYQMETSTNDSLMVVCNDDFFVCDKCGYSESVSENKSKKDFSSFVSFIERPNHDAPWGKKCSGKLYKNKLCHSFKTDVVRLVFGTSRAKNQATMLSVMYALLEATSSVLDIERADIKGCLHKVRYEGSMIYSIVLYDAVAGGAGHVRRMVTEDGAVFQGIIKKAIAVTKGCTCNPSCYNCLRNYYNQKIHDLLNRAEAYSFLEDYLGDVIEISEDEFEKKRVKGSGKYGEDKISIQSKHDCNAYRDWNEFSFMIPDQYADLFAEFDNRVPLPSEAYREFSVLGTDVTAEALFVWTDQKIMVFEDESEKVELEGWKSYCCSEIVVNDFMDLF